MENRLRKKADPTDIVLLLIILFFLAVSLVVAIFVNSKIKDVIDNTALNESSAYGSITSSFASVNETTVQRGFVLFFGLLIIGVLASSFLIKVHPVFIFIYIITFAVSIFVAVYLANTYELLVSSGQIAALAANYAMITYIMKHVIQILVAVGAMSLIIIFGKLFGGGGGSPTDI